MSEDPFVDHYDVLQLSQTADGETIERVYRLLAKRYHPDNATTGDAKRFMEVRTAYEVLADPERRARFDVRYDKHKSLQWQIFEPGAATNGREDDQHIFHGVLSLLYVARREDPESGGLGALYLESMLGVPREHLEFPIWYMKRRGWVETLPSGQYAITVDGIDKVASMDRPLPDDRLLTESGTPNGAGAGADRGAEQLISAGARG